jgi:hypothetical protein
MADPLGTYDRQDPAGMFPDARRDGPGSAEKGIIPFIICAFFIPLHCFSDPENIIPSHLTIAL